MSDDVAREVALSVCELFFAEGWKEFTREERYGAVERMAAALRTVQAIAVATTEAKRHGP